MLNAEIINKVNQIREKYLLTAIPTALDKILIAENIEVKEKDFSEIEEKVKIPISGILYIENGNKLIFVNIRDNKRRQVFTIAHELGHYYLHYNERDNVFISYRGDNNPIEVEANKFAAELLLPSDKVRKEYDLMSFPTASRLADKFTVSEQAMSIKLEQMELKYLGQEL